MRQIKSLELRSEQIKGPGLRVLKDLPKLERLELRIPVDDDQMRFVAALSNLRFLSFDAEQLTDDGLSQLSQLQKMEGLELEFGPRTTNVGYAFLKNMPSIDQTQTQRRTDLRPVLSQKTSKTRRLIR